MVATVRKTGPGAVVLAGLLWAVCGHADVAVPPQDPAAVATSAAPTATSAELPVTPVRAPSARVDFRFGRGLAVVGADGGAALEVRGFLRARQTSTIWPQPSAEALVRNAQLRLDGRALGQRIAWRMQLGLSPSEMGANGQRLLQTALVRHTWPVGWSVGFGRGKVPFGAQRLAHSSELHLSDLSVAVQELHLDRVTGLFVHTPQDKGMDGAFVVALTNPGGLLSFRGRLRPFGAFDDTVEGDTQRLARPRLAVAASVAAVVGAAQALATRGATYPKPWTDYTLAALDTTFKWRGFALHAEWLARKSDQDSADLDTGTSVVRVWSRSAYGAHVQLGQMVSPWLQVAARAARLRRIAGTDPTLISVDELAVALSAHLHGNDFKLLVEVADRFAGALREGELTVRGQVSLFW